MTREPGAVSGTGLSPIHSIQQADSADGRMQWVHCNQ